jgi:hypothetical protein
MNQIADRYQDAADIPAAVPVFPLDRAIVLPRRELPLNIFEPRYLAMVDAALSGDRLIGMVQPTDEAESRKPALERIGGLGRITAYSEQPDGRYVICLTGICRFRIVEELAVTTPFRQCLIDATPFDSDFVTGHRADEVDRARLLEVFAAYLKANEMEADWDSVARSDNEALVDTLTMMSPFGAREKQALLEAENLAARAEILVALTERTLGDSGSDVILQ